MINFDVSKYIIVMNKSKLSKLLILMMLMSFLLSSCASAKHRKKKKCRDCPSFGYNFQIKNERT